MAIARPDVATDQSAIEDEGGKASPIRFTIFPTDAGLADQIGVFIGLFKLGMSLGYRYVHTPFRAWRCNSPGSSLAGALLRKVPGPLLRLFEAAFPERNFDVYSFLGFNAFLSARYGRAGRTPGARVLKIRLNDDRIRADGIGSLAALQAHVRSRVAAVSPSGRPLLVQFRLGGRNIKRGQLFAMIHREIPELQDGLSLRTGYEEARKSRPWPSEFVEGRVRLLAHIRVGDNAVFETPWHTFIPVASRLPGAFKEHARFEDIESNKLLREPELLRFIQGLMRFFAPGTFSTLVFSDGYQRGFQRLREDRHRLNLAPAQIKSICDLEEGHDDRSFAVFRDLTDCKCIIGETDRNLCDLIHSTLTADIVIAQRMLPSLIPAYCGDRKPVVVIPHKGPPPDWASTMSDHQGRFMYVDADAPDFEPVVRRLTESVDGLSSMASDSGHTVRK